MSIIMKTLFNIFVGRPRKLVYAEQIKRLKTAAKARLRGVTNYREYHCAIAELTARFKPLCCLPASNGDLWIQPVARRIYKLWHKVRIPVTPSLSGPSIRYTCSHWTPFVFTLTPPKIFYSSDCKFYE